MQWRTSRFSVSLDHPIVRGVLNVTPDSFSDGGRLAGPDAAIELGLRMVDDGAGILDVGGESTRPGAAAVDGREEQRRVLPVIEGLAKRTDAAISVDTYKATTADAALMAGASIVNDISGLRYEPALAEVVAKRKAAIVLMHTRGRSRDMYQQASYADVVAEVLDELRESIAFAVKGGIDRERVMVDPGLGFAKEASQSFETLARLEMFGELDRPVVAGPSRKSFLTRAVGSAAPVERDWATAAAVTAAVLSGAHIVRVHSVGAMRDVVRVADEIRRYAI